MKILAFEPLRDLLLKSRLVDSPGGRLGRRRLRVHLVLRVCDESKLDVSSIKGDEHGRVDDLLAPDHRCRIAADLLDSHVVVLHQKLDEQGQGEAWPVRGRQEDAARDFAGIQVEALQDLLNLLTDPDKNDRG